MESRPILVTPLAGNDLSFRSLVGDESVNGLFDYDVQVLCTNGDIKRTDVLGASMTVSVPLTSGEVRHFNGLITRFTRIGQFHRRFLYRAQLRPWLWLLSRGADCRIFQNLTIPEIVKKMLRKAPIHLFKESLGDYDPREFLVQYRETDLNFVSRLLEDQGIAYHHVHELGKHTLVLTDSGKGQAAPGYEKIPLRSASDAGQEECFTSWNVVEEVESAAYVLKDFNYRTPTADLRAPLGTTGTSASGLTGEIYDYPGGYLTSNEGKRLVGIRLEQAQVYAETFEGSGPVRGVGPGNTFSLEGKEVLTKDREYLVVRTHYEIRGSAPESGGDSDSGDSFTCSIRAVDAKIHFRPPRVTPKPIVQGPQTATVVTPKKKTRTESSSEDEIWTDPLGRVLVNFHWERLGPERPDDPDRKDEDDNNDKLPCWLRVAELWAGNHFGTVFIPRVGQEVMVEFLEGDPDRPIVTGRLYNQNNWPAYLDEGKKTQSGIRTHSTPGGGPKNFNEIRFDDKKGQEELYLQAEKDQLNYVKHNRTANVDGSDSISVGGDRSVTVTGNLSVTVTGKGGKGAFQSSHTVTGKHSLHASKSIDLDAPEYIKLDVKGTSIEITPTSITLQVNGGGAITIKTDVEAHSNAKSSLHLDADANLKTEGTADIESKVLIAHGTTTAAVTGDTSTVVSGGGSTSTSDASGVTIKGKVINLNS